MGLTDDDRLVYDYDKMIAAAIEENPDWDRRGRHRMD